MHQLFSSNDKPFLEFRKRSILFQEQVIDDLTNIKDVRHNNRFEWYIDEEARITK